VIWSIQTGQTCRLPSSSRLLCVKADEAIRRSGFAPRRPG
jgi:hypothetical protein